MIGLNTHTHTGLLSQEHDGAFQVLLFTIKHITFLTLQYGRGGGDSQGGGMLFCAAFIKGSHLT